jgi:hypothetical protein
VSTLLPLLSPLLLLHSNSDAVHALTLDAQPRLYSANTTRRR